MERGEKGKRMNKKINLLLTALLAALLAGCGGPQPRPTPAPVPVPVPTVQPAGVNRSLSELRAIAAGDVPEPADLSAADRHTLTLMRATRARR